MQGVDRMLQDADGEFQRVDVRLAKLREDRKQLQEHMVLPRPPLTP